MATKTIKCTGCGGQGIIQAYVRVNGGECFECGGTGTEEVSTARYAEIAAADRFTRIATRIDIMIGCCSAAACYQEGNTGILELNGERVTVDAGGVYFRGAYLPKGLTFEAIVDALLAC